MGRAERHVRPAVGLDLEALLDVVVGVEAIHLAGELGVVAVGVEVRDAVDPAVALLGRLPPGVGVAVWGDHAHAGDDRALGGVRQRDRGLRREDAESGSAIRRTPPSAPREPRRSWPTGSRRIRCPWRARSRPSSASPPWACSRGRTRDPASPSWRWGTIPRSMTSAQAAISIAPIPPRGMADHRLDRADRDLVGVLAQGVLVGLVSWRSFCLVPDPCAM